MSDFVIPSSGHQTLSGLLMATPATLTASALTVPPGAFGRVLVGAEPEERRLTELRSEEHTSELQSLTNLVCRLLLEKKKKQHVLYPEHQRLHTPDIVLS